jgi:exosortase D (VPLPA-CTERM-specific)
MHLGWKKLKIIGFPLFFMLTMFPLPAFLNTKLMLQLRLISSKLGVAIIKLYGLSVYQEGNIIDLGFTQLQVVEACSGLHSLISLLVLCLLLVYFFKDHWWKRLALFVSSIPLAIITNSIRIAMTAILYSYFGEEVAQGFFHGFSGLLIFAFCIPVLFIEMKILEKLPPKKSKTQLPPEDEHELNSEAIDARGQDKAKWLEGFALLRQPVSILAIILLGATFVLSTNMEFRRNIPVKKSLNQFPLHVGDWYAERRLPIEQKFLNVLDLSEYVMVDYRNGIGESVNFYVAYYETQSKGKSIHSPASCLPGSGWDFRQSGTVTIFDITPDNSTLRVNRAVMQQGKQYQLSYYWFSQRGRILTNAYQVKLYGFWDALTQQRTDGALIRLVTQVYTDEKISEAEERLQKFVRNIVPVLDDFIPGRELNPGR